MADNIRSSRNILRFPALRPRTGLSRSQTYAKIRDGSFPAPISLGARAVGWLESDIDAWLESQIQKSRKSV
jgi:prophage regulatory protein